MAKALYSLPQLLIKNGIIILIGITDLTSPKKIKIITSRFFLIHLNLMIGKEMKMEMQLIPYFKMQDGHIQLHLMLQ